MSVSIMSLGALQQYRQEGCPPVCPRCGGWGGPPLPDCTQEGWSHANSCDVLNFSDDVCETCYHEFDYTVPDRQVMYRVVFGGITRTHVVRYSNFPDSVVQGAWTRRAADRAALCGALSATTTGIDVTEWPTTLRALDVTDVDCQRCLQRYRSLAKRGLA